MSEQTPEDILAAEMRAAYRRDAQRQRELEAEYQAMLDPIAAKQAEVTRQFWAEMRAAQEELRALLAQVPPEVAEDIARRVGETESE